MVRDKDAQHTNFMLSCMQNYHVIAIKFVLKKIRRYHRTFVYTKTNLGVKRAGTAYQPYHKNEILKKD